MHETKLAERVIELCPDLMGIARTSEQLLSDPRTVQSLVDLVEHNRKEIDGLIELLRKDRAEIERLKAAIDADTKYIALADERIAKLQAVVDAARSVYEALQVRAPHENETGALHIIQRHDALHRMIAALAALETDRQYECYACAEKDVEIERRRKREEQLEKNLQVLDYVEDRCAKQQAEIERLREQCEALGDNCIRHGENIHALELTNAKLQAAVNAAHAALFAVEDEDELF